METFTNNPIQNPSEETTDNENQEILLSDLPTVKSWHGSDYYQYQNHWCPSMFIHSVISFQKHFRAHDSDIILSSFPKSGTTWLKAILFTLVNRHSFTLESSPLLTSNPHGLVPTLEVYYLKDNPSTNLEDFPMPRIFSTHIPYVWLPNSIVNTDCRIVYICRNPLDQFISNWHFLNNTSKFEMLPIEEAFEMICDGVQAYGPFWEHVLGYWKAAGICQKNKILFLKYEDLNENINLHIKNLAEFLGCPFSKDEENEGVIEKVSKLCSFDNMKDLEVNKSGKVHSLFENNTFFREGKVGDWRNYISISMSERLEKIMEEKLGGSGLSFRKEMNMEKDVEQN